MSEAPTNQFQGRLVRLRGITASDFDAFFADSCDTDSQRSDHQVMWPRSPEAMRSWISRAAEGARDDAVALAIETLAHELVGSISAARCDRRFGTFEYGLGIFRPFRRRGYASEAVRLLLRFYFDELRYQKANAGVYAFNEASLKLHAKLGMREEGRIRRAYFSGGVFHDELRFGMTAEEFRDFPGPVGA
jgi:RimJ/RimL family protein N-acetyltransferase